jgi:hypothetical protein
MTESKINFSMGDIEFDARVSGFLASIGFDDSDEARGRIHSTHEIMRKFEEWHIIEPSDDARYIEQVFEDKNSLIIHTGNKTVGLFAPYGKVTMSLFIPREGDIQGEPEIATQAARVDYYELVDGGYKHGYIAVTEGKRGSRGGTASNDPTIYEVPTSGDLDQVQRFVAWMQEAIKGI